MLLVIISLILVGTSANDSLAASIPSFAQRFNFTLPLIVVLLILMFFLLLKVYTRESQPSRSQKGISDSNVKGDGSKEKVREKV